MLELDTVILTLLENQEKINQQNEENFKQIFEILAKLVGDKQTDEPKVDELKLSDNTIFADPNPLQCKVCDKVCASEFGLKAHARSHKPKP